MNFLLLAWQRFGGSQIVYYSALEKSQEHADACAIGFSTVFARGIEQYSVSHQIMYVSGMQLSQPQFLLVVIDVKNRPEASG
jgi:hypothetical protein